jgi:hypothetical protein
MTGYKIRELFVSQLTAAEYCKCRAPSGPCFSSATAATSRTLKWTHTTSKETFLTQFALKEPQRSHAQTGDIQRGTPCLQPRRYVAHRFHTPSARNRRKSIHLCRGHVPQDLTLYSSLVEHSWGKKSHFHSCHIKLQSQYCGVASLISIWGVTVYHPGTDFQSPSSTGLMIIFYI